MAVRGFYCQVCKEFFGDPICAEEHVTSQAHNEKYKVWTPLCAKKIILQMILHGVESET